MIEKLFICFVTFKTLPPPPFKSMQLIVKTLSALTTDRLWCPYLNAHARDDRVQWNVAERLLGYAKQSMIRTKQRSTLSRSTSNSKPNKNKLLYLANPRAFSLQTHAHLRPCVLNSNLDFSFHHFC